MYDMKARVHFSDMGQDGRFRLYELPRLFQDSSIEHSEAVGVGIPYLKPKNQAWLVIAWQINIHRLPEYDERLTIRTWPYEFKSSFGYRNYQMIDESGIVISEAYALWLHTDVAIMKPARIPEEEIERYGCEPRLDMDYLPRKIQLPEEMEVITELPVSPHYSDMYNHLNNAKYVDLASDYLPENQSVKRIRVDYRKQLPVGDVMVVKRKVESNICYIAFCDRQNELHVGTEFLLE